jgi:hypothetical protein
VADMLVNPMATNPLHHGASSEKKFESKRCRFLLWRWLQQC